MKPKLFLLVLLPFAQLIFSCGKKDGTEYVLITSMKDTWVPHKDQRKEFHDRHPEKSAFDTTGIAEYFAGWATVRNAVVLRDRLKKLGLNDEETNSTGPNRIKSVVYGGISGERFEQIFTSSDSLYFYFPHSQLHAYDVLTANENISESDTAHFIPDSLKLSPYLEKIPGSEKYLAGVCKITDTAKVVRMIRQHQNQGSIPGNIRFLWSLMPSASATSSEQFFKLYALQSSRTMAPFDVSDYIRESWKGNFQDQSGQTQYTVWIKPNASGSQVISVQLKKTDGDTFIATCGNKVFCEVKNLTTPVIKIPLTAEGMTSEDADIFSAVFGSGPMMGEVKIISKKKIE